MSDVARLSQNAAALSPLMLSDQLISMAQAADRAGLSQQAHRLLRLAHSVCTAPKPRHRRETI